VNQKALLIQAVIPMNLALILYSYAVFSGRRRGLHLREMIVFGAGLFFDYLGTGRMSGYAALFGKAPEWHNLTGVLSLYGMAFHFTLALLATIVGRADVVDRVFHRVSLTIYLLWVGAFVTGAAAGMMRVSGHG